MNTIVRARRAAPAVATALGLLTVGLAVASVPAGLLAGQPADEVVVQTVGVIPTAAVATLLAVRRPRNSIGWLLLGLSLADAASSFPVHHTTLPLGWGVLASDWPMELVLIAILIWLFPDGLPRGRWRRASVVLVTAGVLLGLVAWASGITAVAEHRFQLGSMPTDPLGALADEYGAEWTVRHPGRYVADHRRLDVTLISDSVPELAEKLRAFTELIKDLSYR